MRCWWRVSACISSGEFIPGSSFCGVRCGASLILLTVESLSLCSFLLGVSSCVVSVETLSVMIVVRGLRFRGVCSCVGLGMVVSVYQHGRFWMWGSLMFWQ